MFTSFQVKNYRCFKDLTVAPLERVNLIAGKNNVGKTALLEALSVYHAYDNPAEAIMVTRRRRLFGLDGEEYLSSLFHGFDVDSRIQMEAIEHTTSGRTLSITVSKQVKVRISNGPAPGTTEGAEAPVAGSPERYSREYELVYEHQWPDGKTSEHKATVYPEATIAQSRPGHFDLPEYNFLLARQMDDPRWVAEKLSDVTERKEKKILIDALKIIEPRLEDLSILQKGRYPVIYADIQGIEKLMPIPLLGEGMSRLLSMALGVASAPKGLLLIDEVENGLHYSVMTEVWKAIGAWARQFNVQVFTTTHSDECIRAAHEAFSEDDTYDFRLHRLDLIKGEIESVTYDRETLAFALDAGWELR